MMTFFRLHTIVVILTNFSTVPNFNKNVEKITLASLINVQQNLINFVEFSYLHGFFTYINEKNSFLHAIFT